MATGWRHLLVVMIDNPMCPGTGHRICNDCMKACIYQKQDPVNIPQIETGVLTEVLNYPFGFEIYSLLTRWNPLNVRRPHALPYNGKKVLVVGLGPAGYTLAHYLINEGFGVVGIDGLKIEPLPEKLTGTKDAPPEPIARLQRDLRRARRPHPAWLRRRLRVWHHRPLGQEFSEGDLYRSCTAADLQDLWGVRFGGTVTIDDAWKLGFDHIAIATGAGKPTIVPMKNNLIRGIRQASDFLMALQLTGAFKPNALANLQVRLPAVVIGGGLTGIDTATEVMAYYPVQVERILERSTMLSAELGEEAFWHGFNDEEQEILTSPSSMATAISAERERGRGRESRRRTSST